MAAAQACGVGAARVAAAVWLLALPVTALIIWLDFDLSPAAARTEAALRNEALRAGILAPLEPGRFRSLAGGRIVVYARGALPNGDLNDVFVKRSEGPLIETTVARRAHYTVSSDGESETITLYDGERIVGLPGSERYRHHALRPAVGADPHARDRRGLSARGWHEYRDSCSRAATRSCGPSCSGAWACRS